MVRTAPNPYGALFGHAVPRDKLRFAEFLDFETISYKAILFILEREKGNFRQIEHRYGRGTVKPTAGVNRTEKLMAIAPSANDSAAGLFLPMVSV